MPPDPDEDELQTALPHTEFGGEPDCCGCLNAIMAGDQAQIVCNECGAVVRTVAAAELQRTLDEMELSLDVASEICPHCGQVNLFPGFSAMKAYTCQHRGRPARCLMNCRNLWLGILRNDDR